MTGHALPRRQFPPLLVLLLILAASLVPRLPILWNAEVTFNSDEAANALVIKHMLEGKDFTFHNWGAHYYGVVEGLLAIPLAGAFGLTPLAFKLAAVAGFLLLVAASYLLGRRVYGPAEGLAAAALLAVFSPQLVLWSTLASGGYTLVVGWGSLTFAHLAATRQRDGRRDAGRTALLGFLVGFGLYIYELFLVYVVILAGFALTSSFLWKALLAPPRQAPRERAAALRPAPGQVRLAALFFAGFLVGWAPKLWTTFFGGAATKTPAYGFAGFDVMRANLELLVTRCAPALFGVNPAGEPDLEQWVGPTLPIAGLVGVLLLLAWGAAWLQAVPRTGREIAGALRRPPGEIGMESLLVLLVPVTALLFVLSPNPTGVLSSRYLLPVLTSLPVLAGGWLVRLWRRQRVAAAALAVLLAVYPGVQTVIWHVGSGSLTPGLRLPRSRDPLHTVFEELRRQGIRGGYGWYWIAYEANFLSREEIVIAPSDGWDRYPAYTRFVDSLPNPAYLFEVNQKIDRAREAQFLERIRAAGRPFQVRRIGQYAVYTSPRGERLLPLSLERGPNRLQQPRAEVAARGVPAVVTPGEILEIPVRLTNRGGDLWPAFGLEGTGHFRVTLSYRWLDAAGREAATPSALRNPLPDDVPPGASVDLVARVQVPETPGAYRLVLTPIQEDVLWFADAPDGGAAVFPVTVAAAAAAAGGG